MAFTPVTPTTTLYAWGQVRWRTNALSHTGRVTPGMVVGLSALDIEQGWFPVEVYNASGVQKILDLFQNKAATGIYEVTLDEILDDSASFIGKVTDVELCQAYPAGTKGWQHLAAKALVQEVKLDPKFTGNERTMKTYRVTPKNETLATATFAFTNDWTPT